MAKFDFNFYEAAGKMAEKGDYEAALHYYFLERNIHPDDVLDVAIGNVYSAMGLYREAIRYYMRAYAANRYNMEAVSGLIDCYKDVNLEAAFYYLNFVLDGGEQLDDIGDYYDEDPVDYSVHDHRDRSEVMEDAFIRLECGDYDGALELLNTINKDSFQYCDALILRASLELKDGNADNALDMMEEALSIQPDNIAGILMKLVACELKKDYEGMDECIKRADELDPKDEDDVARFALCLCNYERYDLAKKYLLRKSEFTPYDRNILLCLCKTYMALDDKNAAWKVANRVCTIYPDDVEVKELSSRILSKKTVRMPDEALKLRHEWGKYLKNLFDKKNFDLTDPENIRRIRWLLQNGEDLYLQSAVCAEITNIPEYADLVDDILIDPFAKSILKRQILLRKLCDERSKKVNIVINNILQTHKIRHPDAPEALVYAYYYAFISLTMLAEQFDRKLSMSFKKLKNKYDQCQNEAKAELSFIALAAWLYADIQHMPDEPVCQNFDCDLVEYQAVISMLGLKE